MKSAEERHGKRSWHQLARVFVLLAVGILVPLPAALDPLAWGPLAWCLALGFGLGAVALAVALVSEWARQAER